MCIQITIKGRMCSNFYLMYYTEYLYLTRLINHCLKKYPSAFLKPIAIKSSIYSILHSILWVTGILNLHQGKDSHSFDIWKCLFYLVQPHLLLHNPVRLYVCNCSICSF